MQFFTETGIGRLFRRSPARASRVDIVPPTPTPGRSDIAICAIMRNEERHIGDWIRFHALAGVRDFYLYDNLSSDETVERASAVPGVNVTILPWKLSTVASKPKLIIPQQIMAYCHAICSFGSKYRWMAFIDVDELLVPLTDTNFLDWLDSLNSYSNISLPWTMFGHSQHKYPPTEAAPFAYTQRAERREGNLLNFKCIVDPCKVTQVSVHKFQTSDMGAVSVNDRGDPAHYKKRSNSSFTTSSAIQLNHYYARSEMELAEKINGGAVSGVDKIRREAEIRKKLGIIERSNLVDLAAPDFLARAGVYSSAELRSLNFNQGNE